MSATALTHGMQSDDRARGFYINYQSEHIESRILAAIPRYKGCIDGRKKLIDSFVDEDGFVLGLTNQRMLHCYCHPRETAVSRPAGNACIIMTGLDRFTVDAVKSLRLINSIFLSIDFVISISDGPLDSVKESAIRKELLTWPRLRYFSIVYTQFNVSEDDQSSVHPEDLAFSPQRPARVFRSLAALRLGWDTVKHNASIYDVVFKTRTDVLHFPGLLNSLSQFISHQQGRGGELVYSSPHPANDIVEISDVLLAMSPDMADWLCDYIKGDGTYENFRCRFRSLLWSPEQILTSGISQIPCKWPIAVHHVLLIGRDYIVFRSTWRCTIENNLGVWLAGVVENDPISTSQATVDIGRVGNLGLIMKLVTQLEIRYPIECLILVRALSTLSSPFARRYGFPVDKWLSYADF